MRSERIVARCAGLFLPGGEADLQGGANKRGPGGEDVVPDESQGTLSACAKAKGACWCSGPWLQ